MKMLSHSGRGRRGESLQPPPTLYELAPDFGGSQHLLALCPDAWEASDTSSSPMARSGSPQRLSPAGLARKLQHGRRRHDTPDSTASEDRWCLGAQPAAITNARGVDSEMALAWVPPPPPPPSPAGDPVDLETSREQALASRQAAEARRLADHLEARYCQPGQAIFEALRGLHDDDGAVEEEIDLALASLRGLADLQTWLGEQVDAVAVALPTRLCFYWLVAWGLVPAAQAKEVDVWVPLAVHPAFRSLMQALRRAVHGEAREAAEGGGGPRGGAPAPEFSQDGPAGGVSPTPPLSIALPMFGRLTWSPGRLLASGGPPGLSMLKSDDLSLRQEFFRRVGRRVSVVLFAESPQHARRAAEDCRDDCLFILHSAGHNPIVLGDVPAARLPEMARRVAAARLGLFARDRGGTNAIFVPHDLQRQFVDALCLHLREKSPAHGVKMLDRAQMQTAVALAVTRPQQWQNAPVFDFEAQRMTPLVMLGGLPPAPAQLGDVDVLNLRAPIFNVLAYDRPADLFSYLGHHGHDRQPPMQVSLMAPTRALRLVLDAASLLHNETLEEWQAAHAPPTLRAQLGMATLQRGHMRCRPVWVAKELKTYFACQRSVAAQARQTTICRTLRDTFSYVLQRLEGELKGNGLQVSAAWYWGDSALPDFTVDAPVRCLLVLNSPCPQARPPVAATGPGAFLPGGSAPLPCRHPCRQLATLMARMAQLPAASGHRTVIVFSHDLLSFLAQPPRLLADMDIDAQGRLTLGSRYEQALLLVEALTASAQAFWRPEHQPLSRRLRAQGEAIYAAWTRELLAFARAADAGLRAASGEHLLTLLQVRPLVLSTVLLA